LKPSTPETPPSPAQEVVRLRSSAREGAAT
jgi:hypothetical protein